MLLRMVVVAGLVLGSLTLLARDADRASACSPGGPNATTLPFILGESTVVAVGRLRNATETEITLEVEEGIKGSRPGGHVLINNRRFGLGPGCEVYIDDGSPGYALPEEARVIAFLQPDISGRADLHMPSFYGYGIYEVDGDAKPFGAEEWADDVIVPIQRWREALAMQQTVPYEPDLENLPPCNPVRMAPEEAGVLARLSVAAAVVSVGSVDGRVATVETEQSLRGAPGASFTLNAGDFWVGDNCMLVGGEGNWITKGDRFLVFLVPDDFNAAEYRLANWGGGALRLSGNWVSGGLPTLADVRRLAAAGIGVDPPPPNASRVRDGILVPEFHDRLMKEGEELLEVRPGVRTEDDVPDQADGFGREWWLAIALAAVAAGGVLAVAGWKRLR